MREEYLDATQMMRKGDGCLNIERRPCLVEAPLDGNPSLYYRASLSDCSSDCLRIHRRGPHFHASLQGLSFRLPLRRDVRVKAVTASVQSVNGDGTALVKAELHLKPGQGDWDKKGRALIPHFESRWEEIRLLQSHRLLQFSCRNCGEPVTSTVSSNGPGRGGTSEDPGRRAELLDLPTELWGHAFDSLSCEECTPLRNERATGPTKFFLQRIRQRQQGQWYHGEGQESSSSVREGDTGPPSFLGVGESEFLVETGLLQLRGYGRAREWRDKEGHERKDREGRRQEGVVLEDDLIEEVSSPSPLFCGNCSVLLGGLDREEGGDLVFGRILKKCVDIRGDAALLLDGRDLGVRGLCRQAKERELQSVAQLFWRLKHNGAALLAERIEAAVRSGGGIVRRFLLGGFQIGEEEERGSDRDGGYGLRSVCGEEQDRVLPSLCVDLRLLTGQETALCLETAERQRRSLESPRRSSEENEEEEEMKGEIVQNGKSADDIPATGLRTRGLKVMYRVTRCEKEDVGQSHPDYPPSSATDLDRRIRSHSAKDLNKGDSKEGGDETVRGVGVRWERDDRNRGAVRKMWCRRAELESLLSVLDDFRSLFPFPSLDLPLGGASEEEEEEDSCGDASASWCATEGLGLPGQRAGADTDCFMAGEEEEAEGESRSAQSSQHDLEDGCVFSLDERREAKRRAIGEPHRDRVLAHSSTRFVVSFIVFPN
uniref:Uncharacterized protein n=1 Tax=Chromera velia CCMP2878 TaxID=1169474 RepID=A0A0G4GWQ1_9ALVE|mmetsp:Transcript_10902/g.21094  ORF Transcript_10902/g.21094 Transcript_10902/m.21094 type:complete len:713 (+) Transcript_10902:49-2187(+)|eukprot:Cvel_23664.t1-p1 / transcript=Cvel_23664.t1 / gene=Cvel_23664 / organism=Chromera_velia_CCMP2878 / gene_product=hypothetical protein / transcript_product=hypothetical protein / location=Cvel_scaffold2464:20119-25092(+) / protein_length=712 / sequence_SO=supercontig / SO=protein_coding / is_pseudo=false